MQQGPSIFGPPSRPTHAINFSHPGELANVIRLFMADQPIADDLDSLGHAYVAEIHRGSQLPEYG